MIKLQVQFGVLALFAIVFTVNAANLADPTVILPEARIALAASYDLGGYTITNDSVPCLMNRIHGSLTWSPFSFLNIGIDAGASQMDVAGDTTSRDTIGIFNGNYGFSGGLHVKLGSRFFYDGLVRIIAIGQATYFSTTNKDGAVYSGKDGVGTVGLQFHVPHFCYVSAGPQLYLIMGENKSYNSAVQHKYSNINNLRGWLAIDYFPTEKGLSSNKLFLSIEVSVSPKVAFDKRAPLQECGFSISFGSITKRLYGEESDVEWAP
jgi:hypothetical protein